jgi:hypothetical protein
LSNSFLAFRPEPCVPLYKTERRRRGDSPTTHCRQRVNESINGRRRMGVGIARNVGPRLGSDGGRKRTSGECSGRGGGADTPPFWPQCTEECGSQWEHARAHRGHQRGEEPCGREPATGRVETLTYSSMCVCVVMSVSTGTIYGVYQKRGQRELNWERGVWIRSSPEASGLPVSP